jgi:hypothetical protein
MAPIDADVVVLVLRRLQAMPLPEENPAQVCYQLGWYEALGAVAAALDVSLRPAANVAPAVPQPALWAD